MNKAIKYVRIINNMMIKRKKYNVVSILCVVALMAGNVSYAASPISKVGGVRVNKGQTSIETRVGYSADHENSASDKYLQIRQHVDYGFTDYYALRVIAAQGKRNHQNVEHNNISIENRFQLIESADHGWDGGLRLSYTQQDGDKSPNKLGMLLAADVPFLKDWEFRHNTILEHEVGPHANKGLALSLRHRVVKNISVNSPVVRKLKVGLAAFNGFGEINNIPAYSDQDHELRPVAELSFKNGSFVTVGYGMGISDASPDHAFKMSFGISF